MFNKNLFAGDIVSCRQFRAVATEGIAQCAAAGMGSCPHAPVFSCTSPCSKTLKLHVPRKPGFSAGISQIYSILHHWKISFTIWIQRFRDWLMDIHKIVKLAKLI